MPVWVKLPVATKPEGFKVNELNGDEEELIATPVADRVAAPPAVTMPPLAKLILVIAVAVVVLDRAGNVVALAVAPANTLKLLLAS